MNGQVIKKHKSNYPDPVEFKINDILELGREDKEYPGWIWVKSPHGIEGWAPMDYIEVLDSSYQGIAKSNYCARELDVKIGEKLWIENTLCGWHYVTNTRSESGWVPQECVRTT